MPEDLEDHVEEIMTAIDEDTLSSADVKRSDTIAFLREIISRCTIRLDAVRSELKESGEGGPDADEEDTSTFDDEDEG